VGKNIINFLEGKNLKNFVYEEKGLLASLGTFDAVAQVKGFTFTGIFAWFIWRTVYLFNFASHQKRAKILFDWTIGLFTGRDTTRF
jgi:NADH dehydrogenase